MGDCLQTVIFLQRELGTLPQVGGGRHEAARHIPIQQEKSLRNETRMRALLSLAVLAALAGCGGGDDDDVGAGANTPAFPTVLAQLNTPSGLSDPAVAQVFDDTYKDSGTTKAQVLDALSKEAVAMSANTAGYSLFPQATLTDTALTNCDAQNVCTLTGTLHNADADETAVPFSTKVVKVGNAYRLLGDQAAG
jgi:hypothetical protein